MPTEQELQATAAEALRDMASGFYTVGGAASLANKPLKILKFQLKSVATLEENREALESGATKLQKIAKVFEKVGPTKVAGKIANKVAGRTKDKLNEIEKSLDEIGEVTDRIAVVVEKVSKTLTKVSAKAEILGIAADVYSQKLAVADQDLESARQLFDTGIPFFGSDSRLTTKLKLQVAQAGEKNKLAVVDIARVTDFIEDLKANIEGVSVFSNFPAFKPIEVVRDILTAVSDALSPLFDPLNKVYDAIGPVLDALSSFFGFLLKPAEWALEAILDATGINGLLDKLADKILSFLPDVDILDGLAERLENELLAGLEEYLTDKIENPFAQIENILSASTFPASFSVPTNGDDALYGSFNDTGPRTIDALAGDDIVMGGAFNDTLMGGAGLDMLIGGGGDDVLDGGTNTAENPDIAVYYGSIDDYGIVSKIENGVASGTWYVADYRDDATVAGSNSQVNAGTDKLVGIEVIFFSDTVLDLREIDSFVRTQTEDGEYARVTPFSSTLPPIAGIPQITADRGNDRIFGAAGLDELFTGGGNDQLSSGSNGPLTIDGQNAVGDYLNGGIGNDIYIIASGSGGLDVIFDPDGIDTADYKLRQNAQEDGLTVVLGDSAREQLYMPTSIFVDASPQGRVVPGNRYNAGVIIGIENIDGTDYDDVFIGSDVINKINGGAGDDQIRGLSGNDILLGGDGNDTLIGDAGDDYLNGGAGANEYIGGLGNDTISDISSLFSVVKYAAYAQTSKYNQSVDFVDFHTSGSTGGNAFDMPGAIVILPTNIPGQQQVSKYATSVLVGDRFGVDYITGIERIIGSTGGDVITTSRDISQTIYSNGGDDTLKSGTGEVQNTFYAGPGDDFFISAYSAEDTFFGGEGSDTVRVWGDNSIDGDLLFGDDNRQTPLAGTDVLDFSQSDYSWHIYMNPGAPNGEVVGKDALASIYIDDPRYIQPTLGVNGVVEKQSGVTVPGEEYPGVSFELTRSDPNTENPGGLADNVGEFEHIIGSANRDIISGGNPDGAIVVEGLAGDDVIYAAQMFEATLEGGDGNDVLGTYNHTLGSDDTVGFFDAGKLTILRGGLGNDIFVAGDFREHIEGGEGLDLLTYEVSTEGVNVDLMARMLDGGYATGDVLVGGIEDVTGSQFDDTLTGDSGANELVGWDGSDILNGGAGADALYGNDGDDEIFGGAGNDVLHGGNGADLLDGGEGNDAATWNLYQRHAKPGIERLTNDLSGIQADLQTGLAGNDTLVSIENLVGGVGNDRFFGDDLGNLLAGNVGDDFLDGRGGNDLLTGGVGDDTLSGGSGDDFLSGGAGTNFLDGNDGVDAIDYGILSYGIEVVMGGVGSRVGLNTGEVKSFTPIDFYIWEDSLTTTAGPTGVPGDIIDFGTDEVRYTYQLFDQSTDDPSDDIYRQEDAITPERMWKLDPTLAEAPGDLEEVRYLPDRGLLPEQRVLSIEKFVVATDTFRNIERIIGSQGNDAFTGNADDTFFYGGVGADTIDGGAGADTASYRFSEERVSINLQTGTVGGGDADGDVLIGIENVDGSAYGDTLVGNAQDNRLNGLGGSDLITGGAGSDTAVFDVASTDVIVARTTTGVRIIISEGTTVLIDDRVDDDVEFYEFTDQTLSREDLAGLIITGTSASEELIGTDIADNLLGRGGNDTIYGRDGNDDISGDSGADRLFGEGGNDTIDGGIGGDTLSGGGGDDLLIGGAGVDTFAGGKGDDTYSVDRAEEVITEAANEGRDEVRATVSVTLQNNVEDLVLEGTAGLSGTGNTLDNLIVGNAAANQLNGLAGDDTLDGGSGVDTMRGGEGDDYYILSQPADVVVEAANTGTDTIEAGFDVTLSGNIEGLVLTGFAALSGTGNARNNTMTGNEGANTLDGLAGDDLFHATMGQDTIRGGAGSDTLRFDFALADATFDFDAPGYVLIDSALGRDRAEEIEFFSFTDQTLAFETLRDIVIRPQDVQLFAADYFVNKTGIDNSREGGGAQFLKIGSASQGANKGNQFHFTTEFEDEGGRALFQGNGFNNLATATASAVRVDFSGGNSPMVTVDRFARPLLDLLDADWGYYETNIFSGDDRLIGSYQNDTLVGYVGDDIIFGGLGDKENYDISDPSTYPNNKPSTIRQAGRVADRAEYLVNDGDDILRGEIGNDLIDGGTGNDTLEGGAGNDHLWGGAVSGKKRLETDAENLRDTGADVLDGGAGDDTLDGGGGNDLLTGGAGSDVFIVEAGMGNDTITDFNIDEDTLNFDALSAAERDAIVDVTNARDLRTLTMADGAVLTLLSLLPEDPFTQGTDGNDRTIGTVEADQFDLLAGNDRFDGLAGNDVARGGSGQDTLIGGAGQDTLEGQGGDDLLIGASATDEANTSGGQVLRIYAATLDRAPDTSGFAGWIDRLDTGVRTVREVANGFTASVEFQNVYGDLQDQGFVTLLYANVLDRTPDTAGLNGWLSKLSTGGSREQVVTGFSESIEFKAKTNDAASAYSTALFERGQESYLDDVFRLYGATLGRAPDIGGLDGWSDRLATGSAYTDIARGFTASTEFVANYGALDSTSFVERLYANVLDREADTAGLAGWLRKLSEGSSREDVVRGFAESAENIAETAVDFRTFVKTQLAGDTFDGGAGNDTLAGGYTADTFIFDAAENGKNEVLQINAWDTVVFEGFGYAEKADALAHMTAAGPDLRFADQGVEILFAGADRAALDSVDYLFS